MAKSAAASPFAADPNAINLSRLLSRLESNLLSPDPSAQTPKTTYERAKFRAEGSSIKIYAQKQSAQSYLQKKRDLIKSLNNRLYELDQLDDGSDEPDDFPTTEDEGDLQEEVPAVADTGDTIDSAQRPSPDEQQPPATTVATNLTSELRARRPQSSPDQNASTTTSASLFPTNPTRNPSADPATARTETLLDQSRSEQETLTESLLEMAKRLRMSSVAFQASLNDSNEVLGRAGEGLEKNTSGMSAAGKRMSELRRMAEGRGWLGRIQLYAYLFVMMVAVTLLVFVGPKLRL